MRTSETIIPRRRYMMRPRCTALWTTFVCSVLVGPASAQWTPGGNPIVTASNDQLIPKGCPDGSGGAIFVWADSRTSPHVFDLYAQRVNGFGQMVWPAGGVAIVTAPGNQVAPNITGDGAGGAIIAWQDHRGPNADVYVQRINGAGAVQWTTDGLLLCSAPNDQMVPRVTSDGSGGGIAVWEDYRTGDSHIYARRVDSAGTLQWAVDGVAMCTAPEFRFSPAIASDGAGGAIATWFDARGKDFDIYAQRVNSAGVNQWTLDGIKLCGALESQEDAEIAADGQGGAIVAWVDFRGNGFHSDLYAQRVGPAGNALWTADGVALCTSPDDQFALVVANDGVGGLIAAWDDTRAGGHDIYTQRVNAVGVTRWTADGLALCTLPGNQLAPAIVNAGPGQAIVAWEDLRSSDFNADLYAQRVDSAGVAQWTAQGLAISSVGGDQATPTIVSDFGGGGAILAWEDGRSGTSSDIYTQRVTAAGIVGPPVAVPDGPLVAFRVLPPTPNPSRARSSVTFVLPAPERATVEILDLEGRRIRTLAGGDLPAGPHTRVWDGRDDAGALVTVGMYLVRVRTAGGTGVAKISILR